MSIHWSTPDPAPLPPPGPTRRERDPGRATMAPGGGAWLALLVIAGLIAIAWIVLTAPLASAPLEQTRQWIYVDIDHRRITLGTPLSDDYMLCPSPLDTQTCMRVGDLRRPTPAGRRWVGSDEQDKRLTIALGPMPIDWVTCLEGKTRRCGLASEWDRWLAELEQLHRLKGPIPHVVGVDR